MRLRLAVGLLAASAAALALGDRLPRAPLLSLAGRLAEAAAPAARLPRTLGPTDPAWAAAVLDKRFLGELREAARELLPLLAAAHPPFVGVPARLLPGEAPGRLGLRIAVPGRAAGADRGVGVVSGARALGIVESADPGAAYVRTLVHPLCAVAAEVVPPPERPREGVGARPRGVLRGRGPRSLLELARVPLGGDVREGDLVVTSGLDRAFPAGLALGTVAGVANADGDAVLEVDVAPFEPAEGGETEAVLYVLPRAPRAEVAAPAGGSR